MKGCGVPTADTGLEQVEEEVKGAQPLI